MTITPNQIAAAQEFIRQNRASIAASAADLLGHLGHVFPKDPHEVTPADLSTYLAPLTDGAPAV